MEGLTLRYLERCLLLRKKSREKKYRIANEYNVLDSTRGRDGRSARSCRISALICEPAKRVELRFPEQVVTVLAHPVQPGEYRLVVHAFALDVEERPFAEGMIDVRQ